jgi:hypothetical protein
MRASELKRTASATAAVALAAIFLGGCLELPRPTLQDGPIDEIILGRRPIHLAAVEVTDARPADELLPLSPQVRYVVPLVVWNQWATEGHERPDAATYTEDLRADMTALVKRAFAGSALFPAPASGAALRVKLRINHLYGVTHRTSTSYYPLVYASFSKRTFGTYGYAQAHLEVVDGAGRVLGTREVVGTFDPNLRDIVSPGTGGVETMRGRPLLARAAAMAAGNLASNVVRAVDLIVASHARPAPLAVDAMKTFFLARAVTEGPFLEVAEVDFETGKVVSDVVVPRWMEPYSAINEWVVDPYHGGQERLTQDEYDALVRRLQTTYDVRYVTDARSAHFFGVKRVAAPIAPRAAPRPPHAADPDASQKPKE